MPQPLAVTAFMASPGRFELPAPRLGGVCSIQLSYGDIFDFSWSRMERSASQDFDDLIIRRRVLYPAELRAHKTSESYCNPKPARCQRGAEGAPNRAHAANFVGKGGGIPEKGCFFRTGKL